MGHNLKFLIITIIAISLTDVLAARTYSKRVVLGDERFEDTSRCCKGSGLRCSANQTGIVGDKVTGSKLADALAEYGGCFPRKRVDEISLIPFTEPSVPGGKIEYGQHIVDALIEKE